MGKKNERRGEKAKTWGEQLSCACVTAFSQTSLPVFLEWF